MKITDERLQELAQMLTDDAQEKYVEDRGMGPQDLLDALAGLCELEQFRESAHRWLPVESAPKDGRTEVLVIDSSHPGCKPFIARCELFKGELYWFGVHGPCERVTDWMPLPDQPAWQVK